jgi:hypothetical protein
MGSIETLSVDAWKRAISGSNAGAMRKRHPYPPQEGAFLQQCCLYQVPTCHKSCFCRAHGSDGVWTLRPDLDFETFLHFYGQLWIGVQRSSFQAAVHDERRQARARWHVGMQLLREVQARWSDWDGQGHSLPELASRVRRGFFCDDAFDLIAPFVESIRGLCPGSSGVYTAKLVSQVFYDIAVPFDTLSRGAQERRGYAPSEYGAGALQRDVQRWLVDHRLSIPEFRQLDNAPSRYWRRGERPEADVGTACSRVLDKLFYG